MGSFSMTCAISGLPIEAGDDVRFSLLTENPYDTRKHSVVEPTGLWFPRTFPLKAVYNDYGSVEKVENSAAKDLWMWGLQLDLKRRGWGSNQCHALPTSKTMTFDSMLHALQEGRMSVKRSFEKNIDPDYDVIREKSDADFQKRRSEAKVDSAIPSIERVEMAIEGADLPKGYLVSLVRHGIVRARWGGYESDAVKISKLKMLQAKLVDYSTTICASPYDTQGIDLMIFAKPGTEDFYGYSNRSRSKVSGLQLAPMMIREDVWSALCMRDLDSSGFIPFEGQNKSKRITLVSMHESVQSFWKRSVAWAKQVEREKKQAGGKHYMPLSYHLHSSASGMGGKQPLAAWYLGKDAIPFQVALGSHWQIMVTRYSKGEVPQDAIDPWLASVAELLLVQMVIRPSRHYWRPSYSCGPQCGEWREHVEINEMFAKIAKPYAIKQDKETAEMEAELTATQ